MKVIILGASGQLGWEFQKYFETRVKLFSFNHSELDILDFQKLSQTFNSIKPDIVINCAAYTTVDQAENEIEIAYKINSIGAKNVSFAAFKINSKVVYFSTDYVFDGNKSLPYTEFDLTNPLSIYGKSKLLGEIYTKKHNPNHLILRISWLYGINGFNFVKSIIRLVKEKGQVKVVEDQIGTPTYTLDVVKQTWELIKGDSVGLYHSSNTGRTTWFEFAKRIVENLSPDAKVIPVKTKDFPTLARRPKFSVLENYLLKLEGRNIMKKWEDAFGDFIQTYKEMLLNE